MPATTARSTTSSRYRATRCKRPREDATAETRRTQRQTQRKGEESRPRISRMDTNEGEEGFSYSCPFVRFVAQFFFFFPIRVHLRSSAVSISVSVFLCVCLCAR